MSVRNYVVIDIGREMMEFVVGKIYAAKREMKDEVEERNRGEAPNAPKWAPVLRFIC